MQRERTLDRQRLTVGAFVVALPALLVGIVLDVARHDTVSLVVMGPLFVLVSGLLGGWYAGWIPWVALAHVGAGVAIAASVGNAVLKGGIVDGNLGALWGSVGPLAAWRLVSARAGLAWGVVYVLALSVPIGMATTHEAHLALVPALWNGGGALVAAVVLIAVVRPASVEVP